MSITTVFPDDLVAAAAELLDHARDKRLRITTAESCTGGLLAALLTDVAGASDVVEGGFVTYSNAAKTQALGVPAVLIEKHGAVSREVAEAMAEGALKHANADLAIAITGIAGPAGGTAQKPVGLVHMAVHRKGHVTRHHECRFGDIGRTAVRLAAVKEAMELLKIAVGKAAER